MNTAKSAVEQFVPLEHIKRVSKKVNVKHYLRGIEKAFIKRKS